MSAWERACHDGKRMLDVKALQAGEGMRWEEGVRGCREMAEGLKGVREGVERAFRFWVMGSSVVARERRRKSVNGGFLSFWRIGKGW